MKRLTFKTIGGIGIFDKKGNSIFPNDIYDDTASSYRTIIFKAIMFALNRMKEYEDTGLSVQEINELRKIRITDCEDG